MIGVRQTISWQQISASRKIPEAVKPWLRDEQSLTEKLIRLSNSDFAVVLLRQAAGRASANEARLLKMRGRGAMIREVLLTGRGQPWVYARTVIPFEALKANRWLSQLRNRPLGQILFTRPNIKRCPATVAQLQPRELPLGLVNEPVWARRSRFQIGQHAILVGEAFLPSLLAFVESS